MSCVRSCLIYGFQEAFVSCDSEFCNLGPEISHITAKDYELLFNTGTMCELVFRRACCKRFPTAEIDDVQRVLPQYKSYGSCAS